MNNRFHWLLALPISLWSAAWCVVNGYNYTRLSFALLVNLKWAAFALLVSPCFWAWIVLAVSVYQPGVCAIAMWGRTETTNRGAGVMIACIVLPVACYALIATVGPFVYPLVSRDGVMALRFIPVLGGRAYE